jgi:uncharacterized membrane protein
MKKAVKALPIIILILAMTVSAADIDSYKAEYDIIKDKAIVQIDIKLKTPTSNFEWIVPEDAEALEAKNTKFETQNLKDRKKIKVLDNTDTITIKYITGSVIDEAKDNFFILDLGEIAAKKSVTVKLPEEATLKYKIGDAQTSIIPETKDVKTDGKRIIISWSDTDLTKNSAILIIYKMPKGNKTLLIASIIGLIIVLLIVAVPQLKKTPKSYKKDLTRNLFEDEKKLVEIILDSKNTEMWQKQLQIESGLSKVKLTRRLRSLEQKGLIEKIPYGSTNKIRVKQP